MANVEDDASDTQEKMFERVVQYIENGSYPEGQTKGRPHHTVCMVCRFIITFFTHLPESQNSSLPKKAKLFSLVHEYCTTSTKKTGVKRQDILDSAPKRQVVFSSFVGFLCVIQ